MPTILVVDDSAVQRKLAGSLLEDQLGCKVGYAADGKDALRQMAQEVPDVVVTDLQMPEMDGLELVAAVKNNFPLVPVILMTAHGSEEIAAQALRLGAASYVPKTKLADDLAPTVERILLASQGDRAHPKLMHYLESCSAEFVLGNELAVIKALVDHVQQMLRCLPLADETERLRVGVALEEALMNACYHGNLEVGAARGQAGRPACNELVRERLGQAPYRDRRIRLSAHVSRTEAVFVIRDQGPGCDLSKLPAGPNFNEGGLRAGRGVTLMRSIMDKVVYNEAGNEVTLIKRRVPEAPFEAEGPNEH